MARFGYRLPQQQAIEESLKFLTWEQFPALLEKGIRHFAVLPQVSRYRQVNSEIKTFFDALISTTTRDFTISGIGSLIDSDKYGRQLKRPTPQLSGTGCNANSLCLEPTCFGFTEGVSENNNILQNLCWSLSMPCLKDMYYSDRMFETKIRKYFAMFFRQPLAVLEAYQRTELLKRAVKVVATSTNFRFSGPVIGGTNGLSLPFWISPTDATEFPDLDDIPAAVGGANLWALMNYVLPRMFANNYSQGMEGMTVYGLGSSLMTAKVQTSSVMDGLVDQQMLRLLAQAGLGASYDRVGSMVDKFFVEDSIFPTFTDNAANIITPITYEVLEPSTIAGFIQTSNPEHMLAPYRALLFVPNNWKWSLVEPPKDDFSFLGLGAGLDFANNTPGVFRLSSQLFTRNEIGEDGVVTLGAGMGSGGEIVPIVRGLRPRQQAIAEAVRTELLQTYSTLECVNQDTGDYSNVGRPVDYQKRADGFLVKSTMHIASDVYGQAKPVLYIFAEDTPRAAAAVSVCTINEVEVDSEAGNEVLSCCPGGAIYAILTYRSDVTGFEVNDTAVFRTGARGMTTLVTVTAVSGNVITVESQDGETLLNCCSGSPDDYGTRTELLNYTTVTNLTSEIFKSQYDVETDSLFLELFVPVADSSDGQTGTLTLECGDVINFTVVGDNEGVFIQIEAADGETFDFAELDCNCLVNAELTLIPLIG